jgi:hypothetical protein
LWFGGYWLFRVREGESKAKFVRKKSWLSAQTGGAILLNCRANWVRGYDLRIAIAST